MKNNYFLAIYNGSIIKIYRVDGKYYFVNSKFNKKELKKSDFIFIA